MNTPASDACQIPLNPDVVATVQDTPASAVVPSREAVDLSKFAGHTPGPWSAVLDETYRVVDAHKGRVCIATNLRGEYGLGGRRDAVEVAANARLMAAAPDLLAEVERLTDWQNRHTECVSELRATVADQAAALAERDKDAEHIRQAIDEQFTRYSDLYDTSVKRGKANAHIYKVVVDAIQWIADRTAALAASVSSASEEGKS